MTSSVARVIVIASLAAIACESRGPSSNQAKGRAESTSWSPALAVVKERAEVPAVSCAMTTRESTVWRGAVGLADVEASEEARDSTSFEAASIAKPIIATAVMQLVTEGKLELDHDVSSYAGFAVRSPHATTPITLRHLLSHTAAIVDDDETSKPASGDALAELGPFLETWFKARDRFRRDTSPGDSMLYSNVGPSLAALIVERTSGERFADYAERHIFSPLKMTSTFFVHARGGGRRVAASYAARPAGFLRLRPPSHALYPVVDLFASASDLARFARAMLRDGELDGARVLPSEAVDVMLRPAFAGAPNESLGWQSRTFKDIHVLGHEGEDDGASTALYIDRARGVGAVVLSNGDAFHRGRAAPFATLIEDLLGRGQGPANGAEPGAR